MASHTLSPSLTLQAEIAGFMDEKLPPLGPGTADRRLEQRLLDDVVLRVLVAAHEGEALVDVLPQVLQPVPG